LPAAQVLQGVHHVSEALRAAVGAEMPDVRFSHLSDELAGALDSNSISASATATLSFARMFFTSKRAYYTERVLFRAPALRELAPLAAASHERCDANGYHRRSASEHVAHDCAAIGGGRCLHGDA
jgi:hypothetical protein